MDQKITQMDQKYEIINKEWIQNNQELLRQSEEGFDQDKRYYTRHADNQTIVYAQGEELGRGKYGKVIKATPYVLDNNSKINKNPPIAMKVFFNQSEKAKEEENKKEMKIIDLYYETDFYGKYPVTTMPLIEGKTLSEFIGTKTCYTMSLDTKLEFCKKILAKCKDFKNRTGHIHGDLHGDNIKVILKNDPDYNDQITVDNIDDRIEVKLIDFGKAEKNGDHQSEVYRLCENFRLISGVNQTSANGMYDIVHQVVSDPDFSDKLKEEFIEKFKEELKETYKEEKGKKERKLTSNDIIIETNFGKHHYIEVKVKDKSKSNKNEESDSVSTDGDIIQYNGTSIMTNHALIEYLKEEDKQKNIMKKGTLDNVQRLIEQIEENNKILIAEYLQRKDKLDKLNIKNEKTLDNMRKLIEHIEEHIEGSNKKIQYNQNTFNEEWHPLTSLVSQMDKQYRPFGWKTECKFPFDAIELALDIKTKQEQEQFIEEKQKLFDTQVGGEFTGQLNEKVLNDRQVPQEIEEEKKKKQQQQIEELVQKSQQAIQQTKEVLEKSRQNQQQRLQQRQQLMQQVEEQLQQSRRLQQRSQQAIQQTKEVLEKSRQNQQQRLQQQQNQGGWQQNQQNQQQQRSPRINPNVGGGRFGGH